MNVLSVSRDVRNYQIKSNWQLFIHLKIRAIKLQLVTDVTSLSLKSAHLNPDQVKFLTKLKYLCIPRVLNSED